jgi:suppressor of G2 allele of SKP1
LPNGSEIAFDIDPLARSIDVSRSTHRVLSMKLEFKLAKKQAGSRWTALEGDEEPADATPSTSAATSISSTTANHAYPSSSKTKKNWDALAADFEKKEADELAKRKDDKDANAGGDKELNELFKSLYAGATDDREFGKPRDGNRALS